jgi:protein involved in polysaccharide export with SLBB domain
VMQSRPSGRFAVPVELFCLALLMPMTSHAETVNGAAVPTDTPLRLKGTEKESLIVTSKYYIGPEDVLDINVWRNKDLSKVVMVRPDGRIGFRS